MSIFNFTPWLVSRSNRTDHYAGREAIGRNYLEFISFASVQSLVCRFGNRMLSYGHIIKLICFWSYGILWTMLCNIPYWSVTGLRSTFVLAILHAYLPTSWCVTFTFFNWQNNAKHWFVYEMSSNCCAFEWYEIPLNTNTFTVCNRTSFCAMQPAAGPTHKILLLEVPLQVLKP